MGLSRLVTDELARVRTRLAELDEEARAAPENRSADKKLVVLVAVASLSLLLLHTYGSRHGPGALAALFVDDGARLVRRALDDSGRGDYWRFAYWLLSIQLCYVAIPLVVVRFMSPRFTLAEVGLSTRHAFAHARAYAILLALVLVPVVALATREGFSSFYPMYRGARSTTTELVLWELIYLPSFFAVELFFRGILLFPFKRRLGSLAVLVPLIPYTMIHFGKPFLEAAGAIVAGLVLGAVALASGHIWLGVVVHMAVALTMDVCAVVFAR